MIWIYLYAFIESAKTVYTLMLVSLKYGFANFRPIFVVLPVTHV